MNEKQKLISDDQLTAGTTKWSTLANRAISDCPKIKKEREIAILCDRFGIGRKAKTLHAIGLTYGVTRERIRQIVNNSIKKIQKNCLSDDLQKNIRLIESQVEKNGGVITRDNLALGLKVSEAYEQNALNFCANLSKKLVQIKESKELTQGWSLRSIKLTKIKDIAKKSTLYLKELKKVQTVKSIATAINEDVQLTGAVLGSSKTTMTTDKKEWGLSEWPNVNPKSIRDKSKYIMVRHGKPMHYSDLTVKIVEMGTKKVTKQSVHNELIKNQEFVLVGRGIYALSEWGYEPGVVEEVIVEVLTLEGGPLHKKEIVSRVLERRIVKESTIVLNLQKDRFKRVDKAVYTLN